MRSGMRPHVRKYLAWPDDRVTLIATISSTYAPYLPFDLRLMKELLHVLSNLSMKALNHVRVQCQSNRAMSEHFLHNLGVNAPLEELRSGCMAKVVDPNLGQLELSGVGLC